MSVAFVMRLGKSSLIIACMSSVGDNELTEGGVYVLFTV